MYVFYYMELIVGKNNKNAIGQNGDLMWDLSKDLQRFRKLTQNQIVVMGRKTYDSIPGGPLKNRINVIITHNPNNYHQQLDNVYFINLDESQRILMELQERHHKKIFIIGGSYIYKHFYPQCHTLHITEVDNDEEGDTYFPIANEQISEDYKITYKETHRDETTNMLYSFCTYEKK